MISDYEKYSESAERVLKYTKRHRKDIPFQKVTAPVVEEKFEHDVEYDIIEATGFVPFKQSTIADHVEKHVLDKYEDSGCKVCFPQLKRDLIDRVHFRRLSDRQNGRNFRNDELFKELCDEYEKFASDVLVQLCSTNRGHCHVVEEREYYHNPGKKNKCLVIRGVTAEENRRLKIVADYVKNCEIPHYIVTTLHRFFPKNKTKGATLKALKKALRREKRTSEYIVAADIKIVADHAGDVFRNL